MPNACATQSNAIFYTCYKPLVCGIRRETTGIIDMTFKYTHLPQKALVSTLIYPDSVTYQIIPNTSIFRLTQRYVLMITTLQTSCARSEREIRKSFDSGDASMAV